MNYKQVGNLQVSNIVLGTAEYGSVIDQKTSFDLIDRYLEMGGNCLDTARLYGFIGKSEDVIGKWLNQNKQKRENIVISTKGGHPNLKTMNVSRLGKQDLEADLDNSLMALGVENIDIYWLHRDDILMSTGEIIETLNSFIKKGKIKNIGASNWGIDRILSANKYAKEHNLTPFVASQVQVSLAKANMEAIDPTTIVMCDEEYQKYIQSGISVFAFSSQGRGILSLLQKYAIDDINPSVKKQYLNDVTLARYKKALMLSERYNVPISAIALSYVYSNYDIPMSVLIGPTNTEFLIDNISNSDLVLTHEELEWLKE